MEACFHWEQTKLWSLKFDQYILHRNFSLIFRRNRPTIQIVLLIIWLHGSLFFAIIDFFSDILYFHIKKAKHERLIPLGATSVMAIWSCPCASNGLIVCNWFRRCLVFRSVKQMDAKQLTLNQIRNPFLWKAEASGLASQLWENVINIIAEEPVRVIRLRAYLCTWRLQSQQRSRFLLPTWFNLTEVNRLCWQSLCELRYQIPGLVFESLIVCQCCSNYLRCVGVARAGRRKSGQTVFVLGTQDWTSEDTQSQPVAYVIPFLSALHIQLLWKQPPGIALVPTRCWWSAIF
jgi:hypothetical protein